MSGSRRNIPAMELIDAVSDTRTDLPILSPSIGSEMIDVRGLHRATGRYAFDPGLTSTGIARSAITYVDGDKSYGRKLVTA